MLTEESTSLALPTVKQVAELLQHHQPLSSEQMEALQSPEFEAKIVQILETYKELVL